MKKTYEPETKSAIEQVIDVFNDYIRTSTHFELLWSDKVGYIYISIDNVQGSIGDTGCCVVNGWPARCVGFHRRSFSSGRRRTIRTHDLLRPSSETGRNCTDIP